MRTALGSFERNGRKWRVGEISNAAERWVEEGL